MRASTVFRGLLLLLALGDLLIFMAELFQIDQVDPHLPHDVVVWALIIAWVLVIMPLAGLWFYHRWARVFLLVVVLLLLAADLPVRAEFVHYHFPWIFRPMHVVMHGLYGAIVAMMFLPPVRDLFRRRPNQALQPTAGRADV